MALVVLFSFVGPSGLTTNTMKKTIILTSLAVIAMGVSAQATPVSFTFLENGGNTSLGTSSTFTESGVTIEAWALGSSPGNLYAKNHGGDENGLGLTSDPTHDDEITKGQYIQLGALTPGFIFDSLTIGSDTPPDGALLYWSATQGVIGTLIGSFSSDQTVNLSAYASSGYFSLGASAGNVLLDGAVGHATVPDGGATVLLLGSALTGFGLIKRKLIA
jgi:hypothetical protein